MALPYDDPAAPSAPAPYFQDNNFAKGIEMRNNNFAIWENSKYLDEGKNIRDAGADTPVNADFFGFFRGASDALRRVTWQEIKNAVQPVGAVIQFAGTAPPAGFLACNGAAVSRTTYADLFAVIGTIYGPGDGATTFNLPDMRGLFVRGAGAHGTMTKAPGGAFDGGSVGATSNDQMQGHYHSVETSYLTNNAVYNAAAANAWGWQSNITPENNYDKTAKTIITDGTNGTPRTGDETKPASISLLYCIKF